MSLLHYYLETYRLGSPKRRCGYQRQHETQVGGAERRPVFGTSNGFTLKIVSLSLLCFLLAEAARADVKGIPYVERFASAQFPWVRTVTGCTSWRRPQALGAKGDHWGAVSFAGACQLHDQCFHTIGTTWRGCNAAFLRDLRLACERDLKQAALEKFQVDPPSPRTAKPSSKTAASGVVDDQALQLCYDIAGLYFERVQMPSVAKRHTIAQAMQGEYLQYVRGVIADLYERRVGRKPSKKEAQQALAMLAQDYSLADLGAALMGAKLEAEASNADLSLSVLPIGSDL